MGTRASWSTPACWPGGVRARLAEAGGQARRPALLRPARALTAPGPRTWKRPTGRTALPSPARSPERRRRRQRPGLTVVLRVAPAGHRADLAVHQGLAGRREAHGLDVLCGGHGASAAAPPPSGPPPTCVLSHGGDCHPPGSPRTPPPSRARGPFTGRKRSQGPCPRSHTESVTEGEPEPAGLAPEPAFLTQAHRPPPA